MRVWVSLLLLLVAAAPGYRVSQAWADDLEQQFQAHAVRIERFTGRLRVEVGRNAPIQLRLDGAESDLEDISASVVDGILVLHQVSRHWSFLRLWREPVRMELVVPLGTPLIISEMAGDIWIGDTMAALTLDMRAGDARIGRVSDATVRLMGRGDVSLAETSGLLNIAVVGSGDVSAGGASRADLRIEGSGDIKLGAVRGLFKAVVMGSGDITATEINGPLDLEINGSGRVRVFRGELSPARIVVNGSGAFEFDGVAIEPDITLRGNGNVEIRAVRGPYKTERTGTGEIRLGRD